MPKVLVLFDVDGTLLLTGGASTRCIRAAAAQVFGDRFRWAPVTVGTLDSQIFRELAGNSSIADAEKLLPTYKECYLTKLDHDLKSAAGNVKVLPGVKELLSNLQRRQEEVVVGLLTGNFRDAVKMKLVAAGIEPSVFQIRAFDEDGLRRCDLVPAALRQFEQLTGETSDPARTILVGDTPRDIACARETGCRVAAVATGNYSHEMLEKEKPDVVLSDLSKPSALLELIQQLAQG